MTILFNQSPYMPSAVPNAARIHREAYLNAYIRTAIDTYSRGNNATADFQRGYTQAIKDLLLDLKVIDPQKNTHQDISVFFGNPERAIAKVYEDRNLRLPVVTVTINDMEVSLPRRRPDFNIVVESYFDPMKRRAERVVSLAPKAVNLNFRINILAKYTEDINQIAEQIELLFHPFAVLKTKFGDSTHAFLSDWADQSIMTAGDREDRIVQKSCLVSVEGYLPTKKYLMTSTPKTKGLLFDDITVVEFSAINPTKPDEREVNAPPAPTGEGFTYYPDQEFVLSDGYTMLYDIYVPNNRQEFGGRSPLVLNAPSTGSWRKSETVTAGNPSYAYLNKAEAFVDNGYVWASYDGRGQAKEWAPGGGETRNAYFFSANTQYAVSGEFGSDAGHVRDLLDIFEMRDHIVTTWSSVIATDRVGMRGGSWGGVMASFAAAWSGELVPIDAITSSWNNVFPSFSGVSALSGNTNYGYDALDTFSTFQAVAIESFHGNLSSTIARDGVRMGFWTGPIRVLALQRTSDHFNLLTSGIMGTDDHSQLNTIFNSYNPFMSKWEAANVPVLMQFSFDDRQRGIEATLDVYNRIPHNNKRLTIATGHHESPVVVGLEFMYADNEVRWFDEHLRGRDPLTLGWTSTSQKVFFMETPIGIQNYQSPSVTNRIFHTTNSLPLPASSLNIQSHYLHTSGGTDYFSVMTSAHAASATAGQFVVTHTMKAASQASSTSEFIDKIISTRGLTINTSEILGSWFDDDSYIFLSPSAFTSEVLLLGSPSATFSISSTNTNYQFSYDIGVYDSTKPLSRGNPHILSTGTRSFNASSVENATIEGRFICARIPAGYRLAIRVKNHTMFNPPIENSTKSTFEQLPYFTDYAISFSLVSAGAKVDIPLYSIDVLDEDVPVVPFPGRYRPLQY